MIKHGTEYFLGNTDSGLYPISFGERFCEPDVSRRTKISENYIVHYIVSGKGTLRKNNKLYNVHGGQIFIVKPYEAYGYVTDSKEPWHYIWITFNGSGAKRLDPLNTVINIDGTAFFNIQNCDTDSNTIEEYITSQLYLFFSQLFAKYEKRSDYVTLIKNYINRNYMNYITVEQMQNLVNLNRQYLSALFKKRTGTTIQSYIIRIRIENAKLFLNKAFSVTETAELCGFKSVYVFSKCFKRETGLSPSAFKESNQNRFKP